MPEEEHKKGAKRIITGYIADLAHKKRNKFKEGFEPNTI